MENHFVAESSSLYLDTPVLTRHDLVFCFNPGKNRQPKNYQTKSATHLSPDLNTSTECLWFWIFQLFNPEGPVPQTPDPSAVSVT